ncbi:ATP-dependent RNA helicase [Sphingomonas ginkgonis]|uniref:ATP-dependent RNA helicase n=2 Tax=Sphingomonas ginkgonis TaxID=2315330 RepID=A0A429VDK4_9SPHN|nr:ATP-dependent RNA helicase [Sphingomonas ginkgonis]
MQFQQRFERAEQLPQQAAPPAQAEAGRRMGWGDRSRGGEPRANWGERNGAGERPMNWGDRTRSADQRPEFRRPGNTRFEGDWGQGERSRWGGRVGDETGAFRGPRVVTPQDMTADRSAQTFRRDRDGRDWRRDGSRWSGGQIDGRWRQEWRQDHRYDWRSYRDRNRSIFRIGLYSDPFGWGYQRFGIGYQLYPGYYQRSFWLSDPWQYRLPPADGPYRWVRYYDDALLVDIYSGEVVDVIYNFFW